MLKLNTTYQTTVGSILITRDRQYLDISLDGDPITLIRTDVLSKGLTEALASKLNIYLSKRRDAQACIASQLIIGLTELRN